MEDPGGRILTTAGSLSLDISGGALWSALNILVNDANQGQYSGWTVRRIRAQAALCGIGKTAPGP